MIKFRKSSTNNNKFLHICQPGEKLRKMSHWVGYRLSNGEQRGALFFPGRTVECYSIGKTDCRQLHTLPAPVSLTQVSSVSAEWTFWARSLSEVWSLLAMAEGLEQLGLYWHLPCDSQKCLQRLLCVPWGNSILPLVENQSFNVTISKYFHILL